MLKGENAEEKTGPVPIFSGCTVNNWTTVIRTSF